MLKWVHRIGIGSIVWWIVDILLPFIPFGGLAFTLGLAYIGFLILKNTLFKDGGSNTTSLGSSSTYTTDEEVRKVSDRVDQIQL